MKSREEIKKWLLENCVDEYGNLILVGLDFSNFNGDVYFSRTKVKYDLIQCFQEVGGHLIQNIQEVGGNLSQDRQKVKGNLYQENQTVKGNLYQDNKEVEENEK